MSPFCDAPTATSARSASMSNGSAASEATTSTTNSAGWSAASIAARMAARSLVMPLEVSVCTTKTAAISCPRSSRSACVTAAGSIGRPSCQGVRTTRRPSASVSTAQDSEKCPVPGTSAVPPGGSRFCTTASQTPWPLLA